jgi:hypothetical protein
MSPEINRHEVEAEIAANLAPCDVSDVNFEWTLRTPHTHFKQGTPLRLILRDGRRLYDRYEGHGSGHIVLREHGKLPLNLVKAVTIWKGGKASLPPVT